MPTEQNKIDRKTETTKNYWEYAIVIVVILAILVLTGVVFWAVQPEYPKIINNQVDAADYINALLTQQSNTIGWFALLGTVLIAIGAVIGTFGYFNTKNLLESEKKINDQILHFKKNLAEIEAIKKILALMDQVDKKIAHLNLPYPITRPLSEDEMSAIQELYITYQFKMRVSTFNNTKALILFCLYEMQQGNKKGAYSKITSFLNSSNESNNEKKSDPKIDRNHIPILYILQHLTMPEVNYIKDISFKIQPLIKCLSIEPSALIAYELLLKCWGEDLDREIINESAESVGGILIRTIPDFIQNNSVFKDIKNKYQLLDNLAVFANCHLINDINELAIDTQDTSALLEYVTKKIEYCQNKDYKGDLGPYAHAKLELDLLYYTWLDIKNTEPAEPILPQNQLVFIRLKAAFKRFETTFKNNNELTSTDILYYKAQFNT